jgi:NADP-dependent 3-hydroxy acid dehydrogenase YdfG
MDTNVKGVLFSMQADIPAMLERGGGVIVNMASIAGLIGFANTPIYVASKHAPKQWRSNLPSRTSA